MLIYVRLASLVFKIYSFASSVYWWLMKKCQSMAGHISNVNPQEDVLEQFSQSVWLRLRRAVCMEGNWSSSRGMTLSLDSGS